VSASPTILNEETRARLVSLLRERRAGKSDAVQFEEVRSLRGSVPVAAGQVLVPAEEHRRAGVRDVLDKVAPRRQEERLLGGELVRLHLAGRCVGDVLDDLRREKVRAHPNAMIPLGSGGGLCIVWKAASTPRLADAPPRLAPPDKPDDHGVRVVVVDNGVNTEARTDGWLAGLQTPANRDPLDQFPAPPDGWLDFAAGHGTFVAGILARTAPCARVEVVREADSDGLITDTAVAEALVAAVRGGASIVNLSLGMETVDDAPPPAFTVALQQVDAEVARTGREVLVVAAAGNSGSADPVYPAACPDPRVVAVAALTPDLTPAPWSSHGPWVTCSTVGERVLSTYVAGTENPLFDPPADTYGPNAWATWTGTSFAAPQVAGRVATLAQEQGIDVRAAFAALLLEAKDHHPAYGALLASTL
jgi:hypothetical protein